MRGASVAGANRYGLRFAFPTPRGGWIDCSAVANSSPRTAPSHSTWAQTQSAPYLRATCADPHQGSRAEHLATWRAWFSTLQRRAFSAAFHAAASRAETKVSQIQSKPADFDYLSRSAPLLLGGELAPLPGATDRRRSPCWASQLRSGGGLART